jgi:hypothetical protein
VEEELEHSNLAEDFTQEELDQIEGCGCMLLLTAVLSGVLITLHYLAIIFLNPTIIHLWRNPLKVIPTYIGISIMLVVVFAFIDSAITPGPG